MKYWLFKSEPETFGIDHLAARKNQTEHWDGVRNYQARNMLRDDIKVGDRVLFYHSNCATPGIVGLATVVKSGYPDFTAWDIHSDHFDPGSSEENPRWYMVDVKLVEKFNSTITLNELKTHPVLKTMKVAQRGNRLSITPVTADEWNIIKQMKENQ